MISAVLLLCALAALAGSTLLLGAGWWPSPAALHVAFAVGVMPLIFTAMREFVPVLTRTRPAGGALHALPWFALLAGVLAVVALAGIAPPAPALRIASSLALVAALVMFGWLLRRARAALGPTHAGLRWYLSALALLLLALAAVLIAVTWWPTHYGLARLLHLHLNSLGFVALTAVGTLQVLMPTVTGIADPDAGARLRTDLPLALAGTLAIALGSVVHFWLGLAGVGLWLVALARLAVSWWQRQRRVIASLHGAAPSLAVALLGLVGLLADGVLHATGLREASASGALFVCAFLLPLVTGTASHLLPVWLRPKDRDWHTRTQQALQRYGGLRALAFALAGTLIWFGWRGGFALALAAMITLPTQFLLASLRRAPGA